MTKMTNMEVYTRLLEVLATTDVEDKEMLTGFVKDKMTQITKKADKARERAAKKKDEPDTLVDAVLQTLSETEYKDIDTIMSELSDLDIETTRAKVTSRLSALGKEDVVVKTQVSVDGKKRMGYKFNTDRA